MKVSDEVLRLLEEGSGAVSGEEMANTLGISRNSIWKAVRKLRSEGYDIDAKTNWGYTLVSDDSVLSSENIHKQLKGGAKRAKVDVRTSVTSTNTVVKEIAENGGAEGSVVIAQHQTAGRGRLGRTFYSPRKTGIYMSILLRPKLSAQQSLMITTAASVAVAEAIEKVTGRRALIKWVNDIYVDGYKVCGILTEASMDVESHKLNYAVLGIGINICEPDGGFTGDLKNIAAALFETEPPAGTRPALVSEILNRFFGYYDRLETSSFMEEYRERSLLTGMRVTFMQGKEEKSGLVTGVDDRARLLVRLDDGAEHAFFAGEVNIEKDFLEELRRKL